MVLYLRVPNRPQKAVYSGWRLEKIPGDLSPFSKESNGFIPPFGKTSSEGRVFGLRPKEK